MGFVNCLIYLIVSGLCIFFIGRIFPRKFIKEKCFPFKSYKFEKNGKIYEKIKIKKWKTKLPDASVIIHKFVPKLMPEKRIRNLKKANIETLVKESCVAEMTHFLAALCGFLCIKIWYKKWGVVLSIINMICHIPFILIQRYNRPRLEKFNLN